MVDKSGDEVGGEWRGRGAGAAPAARVPCRVGVGRDGRCAPKLEIRWLSGPAMDSRVC